MLRAQRLLLTSVEKEFSVMGLRVDYSKGKVSLCLKELFTISAIHVNLKQELTIHSYGSFFPFCIRGQGYWDY